MRRCRPNLPIIFFVLLTLSACQQQPTPRVPLDFDTDPRILRGVWTGETNGVRLLFDLNASELSAEGYVVTGTFQLGDDEPVVIEGYATTPVTVPQGSVAAQDDAAPAMFDAASVVPGWRLEGSDLLGSPARFDLQLANDATAEDLFFEVTAQGETALSGTEWTLESVRGKPVVDATLTLEFGEKAHGGFSGFDGCNYFGARYLADETNFEIVSGILSTAIGCETEAIEARATAYTSALSDATTYSITDGRLAFADEMEDTVLTFTDTEQPPMDPAALLGTSWRLTEANGEGTPAGAEMTIAFPRARVLTGTAGCVSYYGVYDASGNDLLVAQLGANYDDCAEGENLEGAEEAYSEYFSTLSDFWLEGETLRLYTRQGDVLLFEAAPQ